MPVWEHCNPRLEVGALAQFLGHNTEHELHAQSNQSLSPQALRHLLCAFSLLCAVVAAFSFLQGNVMAPFFLLVNMLIVAGALWALSNSKAYDRLTQRDNGWLQLSSMRAGRALHVDLHPSWLVYEIGPAPNRRILISGQGHAVEFGSFLNNEQRARLGEQLVRFIDLAKARALSKL
jgi:uncharacterized membrane protein